jgi:hypothetical protein
MTGWVQRRSGPAFDEVHRDMGKALNIEEADAPVENFPNE